MTLPDFHSITHTETVPDIKPYCSKLKNIGSLYKFLTSEVQIRIFKVKKYVILLVLNFPIQFVPNIFRHIEFPSISLLLIY